MLEPSRFARMTRMPFAIAPVKLAVLLIELQLLGSEGAARRNNVGDVASVKIRALDGAVIGAGVAHVGPVEVTGFERPQQCRPEVAFPRSQ